MRVETFCTNFVLKQYLNVSVVVECDCKNSTPLTILSLLQGYSHLAAACRIHQGVKFVDVMLLELVQKTEEIFLTGPASSNAYDNQVKTLTHKKMHLVSCYQNEYFILLILILMNIINHLTLIKAEYCYHYIYKSRHVY